MEDADLLEVAREAALAAVEVHRRYAGRVAPEQWSSKGTADFVSHVDHEAEARIAEVIQRNCPGHRIMAEEAVSGSERGMDLPWHDEEWLWIVDPLDGTTNYLHGYPMYSVSVAVAHRGELRAGVVASAPTGEVWTAHRGGGAFRNGEPIHVSTIDQLKPALIGTGFPFKNLHLMPVYLREFDAVMHSSSGVRRAGSAALDLCHVATGWFDGFWEPDLYPWDIAAGTLMIREAGGIVTSVEGELSLFERTSVLAGNPAIHRQLGQLLHQVGD